MIERYNDEADKDDLVLNAAVVAQRLSTSELLAALAEESAELCQAALKLGRAIRGENPTPVTVSAAKDNLLEEIEDVLNCVATLEMAPVMHRRCRPNGQKMDRWVTRILSGSARSDNKE